MREPPTKTCVLHCHSNTDQASIYPYKQLYMEYNEYLQSSWVEEDRMMSNGWMIHAKVIYSCKYRHILILRYVFSRLCDIQNINTLTLEYLWDLPWVSASWWIPLCDRGVSKGSLSDSEFPSMHSVRTKTTPAVHRLMGRPGSGGEWSALCPGRSVSRSLRAAGRSPVGNTRGFDPMAAMTTPPLFSAPNLPHLQTLICFYPTLLLLTPFDWKRYC